MPSLEKAHELYFEGRAMMISNRFEEAIPLLQRSNEIWPHFKTLELLGECFKQLGRLKEAITPLAAAAGLNKGVRARSLLAEVFLELDDLDHARDHAEIVIGQAPNNRNAKKVMEATEEHYRRRNL